ncbi:MAG: hypothetical protein AVDCRST_MAG01-01-2, partial [uncultured Rubrobacteraceae bacterium]
GRTDGRTIGDGALLGAGMASGARVRGPPAGWGGQLLGRPSGQHRAADCPWAGPRPRPLAAVRSLRRARLHDRRHGGRPRLQAGVLAVGGRPRAAGAGDDDDPGRPAGRPGPDPAPPPRVARRARRRGLRRPAGPVHGVLRAGGRAEDGRGGAGRREGVRPRRV